MALYVWQQDLERDFPLAVLECAARGDADRAGTDLGTRPGGRHSPRGVS